MSTLLTKSVQGIQHKLQIISRLHHVRRLAGGVQGHGAGERLDLQPAPARRVGRRRRANDDAAGEMKTLGLPLAHFAARRRCRAIARPRGDVERRETVVSEGKPARRDVQPAPAPLLQALLSVHKSSRKRRMGRRFSLSRGITT